MSLGSVKSRRGQVADTTTPEQAAESVGEGVDPLAPTDAATEIVKLKNKWMVRTHPGEQAPLGSIELPPDHRARPGD